LPFFRLLICCTIFFALSGRIARFGENQGELYEILDRETRIVI